MEIDPNRSRPFATALLFSGTVACLLVLGEVALRVAASAPGQVTSPPVPEEWRDLPKLEGLFDVTKPNVRGLTAGALFETNRHGFRGPDRAFRKPEGVFRIVLTGDSVAMGWGVVEEDTYAARLARSFDAGSQTQRFEILNIAVSGLNTFWAVDRFHRLGLRFDPDLAIYGFTLNDIEGDAYRRTRKDSLGEYFPYRESPSYLWRFLGPRLVSLRELVSPPVGSYIHELNDNYLRNPDAWAELVAGLDRLAETSRKRDMCAVLFLHTRLHFLHAFHPFGRLYDRVAAAAEQRGLFVVRSFHRFRGRDALSLWVNRFDPHPNAEGHALLAQALEEGLRELPARCWEPVP